MEPHPLMVELDELREQRGWSRKKWALEAHLAEATLHGLMGGRHAPSVVTLEAAAAPFGRTLMWAPEVRGDSRG